nr:hypothetical protein [Tanacetum cinerariifolium]
MWSAKMRKSRKEQALLFKVDYQKAFESVRWDHLDDIMVNLASVVNGKGRFVAAFILQKLQSRLMVRQLTNSYFIEVIDTCMFVPILVGENDLVYISYQSYADDVMFNCKGSTSNVNVLMMILHWFFLVPGLKVNVHKSSLHGLGVRSLDI